MSKVITGMSMSVDGFINDRHGSLEPLYPDFKAMHDAPSFIEMVQTTGAVVMGRHAFNMGKPETWGDYEFQVPIFVLTHSLPTQLPEGNGKISFTFVTDGIASAISQAKRAAGDKNVQIIGGASTFQQSLNSGLCDELSLDIVPVLLGEGLRLFANIDSDTITLEKITVEDINPVRTSLRFKITKL
jgi:dihydrofolate reductase